MLPPSATIARLSAEPRRPHLFPLVPLAFYTYTCGRTIGSSDTALLVDEMRTLNLSTHVNHHNLTILAGWIFSFLPIANAAWAANLVSAVLGTLAVSAFYVLVLEATGRRAVAAASALLVMVSHSMWWHSTIAEVYAANALLTAVFLILLQRAARSGGRELGPMFFVAGLAIFNHAQMGVLLLGAAAYLALHVAAGRRASPPAPAAPPVLRAAAWFAAGILPYALVFAKDVMRTGSLALAADEAAGGDFKSVMMKGAFLPSVGDLLFLVALQFPSPFLLLVIAGASRLRARWKDPAALAALAVLFAVNTGFFMFYDTWDKFAFLLPSFLVLAFCGALGVDDLVEWIAVRPWRKAAALAALAASVAAPVALYSRLGKWAHGSPFLAATLRSGHTANTPDVGEYVANPDKRRFREYADFITALFARLPENAVFVDDDAHTYYPLLYYQKYEHARRDVAVALVNVWGFEGWGMDRAAFQQLLAAGHSGARRVFLISVGPPFGPWIVSAPGSEGYRFKRFPLAEGRWVYELLGAEAGAAVPVEPPAFTGMVVGQGFSAPPTARVRTGFASGDRVEAAVAFEANTEPFELRFRWVRPDGTVLEGEPMTLPFGCVDAWQRLDAPPPLAAGRWTVEAIAAGRRAAAAAFQVAER